MGQIPHWNRTRKWLLCPSCKDALQQLPVSLTSFPANVESWLLFLLWVVHMMVRCGNQQLTEEMGCIVCYFLLFTNIQVVQVLNRKKETPRHHRRQILIDESPKIKPRQVFTKPESLSIPKKSCCAS